MIPYIKKLGVYEVAAFITGFALMAFELAASRVLAPAIGSSTYIWTSVIGVIIASLSLGYAAGGVVADKRTKRTDLIWLLLISAGAVVVAQLVADPVLSTIRNLHVDVRIQGLLASFLLFMPASFVLGMISPYLARLKTTAVTNTGRSVASLSAMNAIGGIVGTLTVGFIFFGFIGTKETIFFTALILIAASWAFSPLYKFKRRVIISIILLVFGFFSTAYFPDKSVVAEIDTPTSKYLVSEVEYNGKPIRALSAGPRGFQSGVYTDGSTELAFAYTRTLADFTIKSPHNQSVLMLGGGALTIPAYIADRLPDSNIDVVEIDPYLESIAKTYFNYYDRPNVRFIAQDARAFLQKNDKEYDVVLVDVYNDLSIPFSLATREYANLLRNSLKPDGTVITNIAAGDNTDCSGYLRGLHGSYTSAFKNYSIFPQIASDIGIPQNLVAVYSNSPQEWLKTETGYRVTDLPANKPFTDNFAPVERLIHQCEA